MEPPTPDSGRPAKRARSAIACQRCKHRKQRCDNGFPACANCLGAGEPCSYGASVYPADYVRSLESHIAVLEQRLMSFDPRIATDHMSAAAAAAQQQQQQYRGGMPGRQYSSVTSPETPSSGSLYDHEGKHLEIGAGFVALSSNTYLGTSSGFPLAKLVQSAVNVSILNAVHRDVSLDEHEHDHASPAISSTPVSTGDKARVKDAWKDDGLRAKATMPPRAMGDKLVEAYLTKVHPKHPFLARSKIRGLHERRMELRPCTPRSTQPEPALEERLDYFMLHMVYAIGARYLQLAEDYEYIAPEAHYAAAIEDIDAVFDVKSLENLEGMLLLAIYQLRSPSGPGIWWMIGITMRHCLDSGLHRKTSNLPNVLDQRRKRLFWTVYMLERSVARTLGRPCCVTDREIDVDLPANVPDDIVAEEEMTAAIASSVQHPHQLTPLAPAIHIIRIQRIESKIHHTVHRVDRAPQAIAPHKVARLRDALEDWKHHIRHVVPDTSTPSPSPAIDASASCPYLTADYHMIQYHKALLLLILPFLPSLPPTHPDFRLCAHAAGQICRLYKRLHDRQASISYSLLALHASFVAGLTLVYCFWVDRGIFDARFSADVRACSTVLYIIAERWPAARKVRNAFESLVEATVEGGAGVGVGGREDGGQGMSVGGMSMHHPQNQHQQEIPPTADQGMMNGLGMTPGNSNDVWDLFGTVLDDRESSWRWAQEGFFNAMGTFPEYGWIL